MTIIIKIIKSINQELKQCLINNTNFIIYKQITQHNQDFAIKIKLYQGFQKKNKTYRNLMEERLT